MWRSFGWRSRANVSSSTARRCELPLPDGPGKALKLTISPVQERIPIYLAAIGPKNTALAGEIADGWIPTLFSPEHVSELRPLLEEGATRSGKSLDDFDIAPTVNVFVTDDLEGARDAMRPFIALYVGGMGSREQNFYNQRRQRYGFEARGQVIQDLLPGRQARGGDGGDPGRADRHGVAVRPARRGARAAGVCIATRAWARSGSPRPRSMRRSAWSSCGSSPSSPQADLKVARA